MRIIALSLFVAMTAVSQDALAQLAVGEVAGTYQSNGTSHRFHGYVAVLDLSSRRFLPVVRRPPSCGKPSFAPLATTSAWANSVGVFLAVNGSFSLPEREYKPGDCLQMIGPLKSAGTLVVPGANRPDGQGNPALLFNAASVPRITMAAARDVASAYNVLSGQWQECTNPAPNCPPIPHNGTLLISGGTLMGATALPVPDEAAPRTAVGLTRDSVLIVVMIEGRLPDSDGIDLPGLAELLNAFQAYDAVNLDGGGSSTMMYAPVGPLPAEENLKLYTLIRNAQRQDASGLTFTFTQRDPRVPFASRASDAFSSSGRGATGNRLYRPVTSQWGFRLAHTPTSPE